MRTMLALGGGILAALLLTSCGEEDAAAVRVKLLPDFSGTITTSSVIVGSVGAGPTGGSAGGGGIEQATSGVRWDSRGQLAMASGAFKALNELKVGDMSFARREGERFILVTIPRGKDAKWPGLLGVVDEAARANAVKALAPDARETVLGAIMSVRVTLPPGSTVVSSAVTPTGRGLAASVDGGTAILVIPMKIALAKGVAGEPGSLEWHITWTEAGAKGGK